MLDPEEIAKKLGCPELGYLSDYLMKGVIRKGNMIFAPSVKTDVKVGSRTVHTDPGFVKVMSDMFAGHWQCHSHIDNMDLKEPAFLYELNCYASEEKKLAKELFPDSKTKDEWLVAKQVVADTLNDYRQFTDKILSESNVSKFAMFAYCDAIDPESSPTDDKQAVVVFLGTYELDKAASLYYHRLVLHLFSTDYRFLDNNYNKENNNNK